MTTFRQDRGRGATRARVRTPQLIRSYLLGEDFSSEVDVDEQAAQRPLEGDYLSRMHRRIKRRIREANRRYQYPRHHSFQTLMNNLVLLGLVEKTDRREPGVRSAVPQFQERHYYRLAPGADARPEWLDPMAFIALRYPGIRQGVSPLPSAAPEGPTRRAPRRPTDEPPRRILFPETPPRPGAAQAELRARLAELQERKTQLADLAQTAQSATLLRAFQQLLRDAEAFQRDVTTFDAQNPLIDLADAVGVLRGCAAQLGAERGMTQQRASALRTCQSAARLLGEALEPQLRLPGGRAPGFRRGSTAQTPRPAAPAIAPLPAAIAIPSFTLATKPTKAGVQKLLANLERLKELNGGSDMVLEDGEPLIKEELDRLASALDEWQTAVQEMVDTEENKDNPNEDRLDALGDRLTAIEATVADLDVYDIAAALADLEGASPQ